MFYSGNIFLIFYYIKHVLSSNIYLLITYLEYIHKFNERKRKSDFVLNVIYKYTGCNKTNVCL